MRSQHDPVLRARRWPQRLAAVAAIALLGSLAACSSGSEPSSSSAPGGTSSDAQPSTGNGETGGAETSSPAKTTTVRIGYQSAADYGLFYVGVQKGWFKDAGLNVELSMFSDGTTQIAALIGGSIDVTLQGAQPALIAAQKNAAPIRFMGPIADAAGLFSIVTDPDITSVTDLKGKTVAVQTASAYDFYLQNVLNKYGMSESDVQIQNLTPLDGQGAFLSKKVNAVVPLATSRYSILQQRSDAKVVFSQADWAKAPNPTVFSIYDLMITTQPFADANASALEALMGVYYGKIVPYVTGKDTAAQAVSDLVDWQTNIAKAKTDADAVKQLGDAYGWYDLARAQKTVASGEFEEQLAKQAQFFVDNGAMPSMPDVKSLAVPDLIANVK